MLEVLIGIVIAVVLIFALAPAAIGYYGLDLALSIKNDTLRYIGIAICIIILIFGLYCSYIILSTIITDAIRNSRP